VITIHGSLYEILYISLKIQNIKFVINFEIKSHQCPNAFFENGRSGPSGQSGVKNTIHCFHFQKINF